MITYQYARGKDDRIVNILDLTADTRRDQAPYFCLGCEKELTPKLPKVKSKHFAHKITGNCSKETYLHLLAKKTFLDTYISLREAGKPFYFSATYKSSCTKYTHITGESCSVEKKRYVDLIKWFPYIYEEKHFKGFRPDILLSEKEDPNDGRVIFVEIAVSHFSEKAKIDLGERIIELVVFEEEDIERIKTGQIDENDVMLELYNFNKKEFSGDVCSGNCKNMVNVFYIYPNGECKQHEVRLKNYATQGVIGAIYHEILPTYASAGYFTIFRRKIREIFFKGIPIKNCFLCKFHGKGTYNLPFCKIYKTGIESNFAVDCRSFRTLKSQAEYDELDKQNDSYKAKRERRRW